MARNVLVNLMANLLKKFEQVWKTIGEQYGITVTPDVTQAAAITVFIRCRQVIPPEVWKDGKIDNQTRAQVRSLISDYEDLLYKAASMWQSTGMPFKAYNVQTVAASIFIAEMEILAAEEELALDTIET